MLAKGQNKISILAARHTHGEVVVYAFFKTIEYRQAQGTSQMDFGLPYRIVGCVVEGVN
jgi:hypothetical protein